MNVCVFCGSSTGVDPVYSQAAKKLGENLAMNSMRLIYGGGKVGLMGVVADSVMAAGGEVIGVIPDFLMKREVGHLQITQLEIVESMHQRKKRMADLADAFIAMPGGWGTMEELTEVLTWRQLGLITKPILLLNTQNFFKDLLLQMDKMILEGFVRPEYKNLITVESSPEDVVQSLYRLRS